MFIWHKASSFPDEQLKMCYEFSRLKWIALGQILPQVEKNGNIALPDLPALMWRLDLAFAHPEKLTTAEQTMREITPKNHHFSQ